MADNKPGRAEVKFNTLTYGGDALGRLADGRAVFAPFLLPGETAEIEIVEEKRGHVRARPVRILEPSPERIEPRCVHFGECGGCHYQHMSYEHQTAVKQAIVKDQFLRVAGMPDAPVQATLPSDPHWYYRNSLQFHLDPAGRLGFQKAASHQVLAIRECHLPESGINELWPRLEFDPQMKLERVVLRCDPAGRQLVVLESESGELPEFETDMPISVIHRTQDNQVVLAGEDGLEHVVKGRTFRVSAGSFFQVNTHQAERMVDFLREELPLKRTDTVLDVYCGVGLFSAFLAEEAGQVIGIEVNESACEDFAANLDAFDNVSLYQGAAEAVLPALEVKPTAIVVDPPRAGIELPAMDAILRSGAQRIVYISCDPATLARDAKRLSAGGYMLRKVVPLDMFPHTFHVECMVLMTKG